MQIPSCTDCDSDIVKLSVPQIALVLIFAIVAFGVAKAENRFVVSIKLDFLEPSQQPSKEEFLLAAKRAFYTRNVEFKVVNERTVRGMYGRIEYEIRRLDNAVEVRWIGGITRDHSGAKIIDKHLNNIKRDLVYELGKYLL